MRNKRKMGYVFLMSLLILCCSSTTVFAADTSAEYVPQLYATIWSLVPPVVAIVLALITKEVYSSLFVGILIGGVFWSGFKPEATILHVFQDGIVGVLTDSYNMGILVFLVILGVMVCMMNKAGGSAAFGRWAKEHIKTRAGAQLATITLGVLIFIDDYFNCLTVGSVMRPVTDSHNVSRAKLAYLIDATAAPVCIIAPISSWAAAVTGFVKGEDGFSIFIRAIPYNYYAFLTIIMMVTLVLAKEDYGPMKAHEKNAIEGDLFTTGDRPFENTSENAIYNKGKVLRFSDSMACIPEGFKAMVPAILILTFAWTLKAMTDSLGAAPFVASVMNSAAGGLMNLLPAIIFLVGCFLAFATGTSWGTFGILIPIVVAVFQGTNETMMIISISACMAGAVCGDHCSPISDTTIMASAGAQCNHVNHVSTQLPYAMTVAAVSCITYVIAGILQNAVICLVIGIALQIGVLLAIKEITKDHTGRVKTTN